MLGPYKVEIFSRDMQFRSAGILADPTLQEDYLTLEGTSITVGNIALQKGDFAHVTDLYGDRIYQGIVSDIVADREPAGSSWSRSYPCWIYRCSWTVRN